MASRGRTTGVGRDIKVENLRIVHEHDEEASEPELSGDPDYRREDEERIEAWRRDEWWYLGVYVEIDLVVSGTLQTVRSPGLWGVESDSDDAYFRSVASDEYDELLGILGQLGVSKNRVPPLADAREIDR
jgi:hypothetical protein